MTDPQPEIVVLLLSLPLFLVYMAFQGGLMLRDRGFAWGAGARDDGTPLGQAAARADRAFANLRETYPIFLALAVAIVATGRGGAGEAGAWLWFGARVVYLPLYLLGVPWVRSVAYGVSLAGLAMMAGELL